jgi:uncharacterized membrane protein
MTHLIAYLSVLLSMAAIDAVWLKVMKGFYVEHIGHLMAQKPTLIAGAVLYLLYAVGVTTLIIMPALNSGSSFLRVFLLGLLFGLVAYGAYDLTNQATLKEWPIIVTIVDMAWGALITGTIAVIGLYIARLF